MYCFHFPQQALIPVFLAGVGQLALTLNQPSHSNSVAFRLTLLSEANVSSPPSSLISRTAGGPASPAVLGSVLVPTEHHRLWLKNHTYCLRVLEARGLKSSGQQGGSSPGTSVGRTCSSVPASGRCC